MGRPNQNSHSHSNASFGYVQRVFPDEFQTLLTSDYNEGTSKGKKLNEIDPVTGQSKIYITQPDIEKKFETIVSSNDDAIKCLVGFTGIGKTTLLKNVFRLLSTDLLIDSDTITVYISFQHLQFIDGAQGKTHVIQHITKCIEKLCLKYPEACSIVHSDEFASCFYEFFKENFEYMTATDDLVPSPSGSITFSNPIDRLAVISNSEPLKYKCAFLSFLLSRIDEVGKIILVFDDFEKQKTIIQKDLFVYMFQIYDSLTSVKNNPYLTKLFFAVKSYTFREHVNRELIARRFDTDTDIILKETIPPLEDIFKKRFDLAASENGNFDQRKGNWEAALSILLDVSQRIMYKHKSLICRIANNNIVDAFRLYTKILTNHKYIAPAEDTGTPGAFQIKREHYNIETIEPIFKAMALGEGDVFIDYPGNLFCNILHVHNEKMPNCEMLGLYIIQYFLTSRTRGDNSIYGAHFEIGRKVVKNIVELYQTQPQEYQNALQDRLNYMMEYLYRGSVLLRSIYDYEASTEAEVQVDRVYHEDFGIYISWRGIELFDQLSENALLFELLRDDIDTSLPSSDQPSSRLSKREILMSLIDYSSYLFSSVEKKYIQRASKLETYCRFFGNHFLTCNLFEGILQTMRRFYQERDYDFILINNRLGVELSKMLQYSKQLKEEKGITIGLTTRLSDLAQKEAKSD